MGKLLKYILILVAVLAVGGVIYLATAKIPAPSAPVEKAIPDDKLPQ